MITTQYVRPILSLNEENGNHMLFSDMKKSIYIMYTGIVETLSIITMRFLAIIKIH